MISTIQPKFSAVNFTAKKEAKRIKTIEYEKIDDNVFTYTDNVIGQVENLKIRNLLIFLFEAAKYDFNNEKEYRGAKIFNILGDIAAEVNHVSDKHTLEMIAVRCNSLRNKFKPYMCIKDSEFENLAEQTLNICDVAMEAASLGCKNIHKNKAEGSEDIGYEDSLSDFFTNIKGISREQAREFLNSEILENKTQFAKDFNEDNKQRHLINFIENNYERNFQDCKYLYKTYYLNTLPKDVQEYCMNILKEHQVYVFLSGEKDLAPLKYIDRELHEWKAASAKKAIMPYYIKVTNTLFQKNDNSAYAHIGDYYAVKIKGINAVDSTLRHEMTHINDTYYDKTNGSDDKTVILDGKDISYKFGKLSKRNWYRDELQRADAGLINYAYTDRDEFIAVASEGDYNMYSDEFKKVLVKLGLPPWVFKMISKNKM